MAQTQKHLIIYAHPNLDSFNKAILDRVVEASNPHEVMIRDLNHLQFNPILNWQECLNAYQQNLEQDVIAEQQLWKEADLITFIYPLWWMGFPAILKGYLDRVLTHGFAYQNQKTETVGLLKGKRVQQFVTMGNSNERYEQKGFLTSLDNTLGNGLFNFCGIENVKMHFLGSIGLPTNDYPALLTQVQQATQALLNEE